MASTTKAAYPNSSFEPNNHCQYVSNFSVYVCVRERYFKHVSTKYSGADKSLARPTSRCILFDGENISFDASKKVMQSRYKPGGAQRIPGS